MEKEGDNSRAEKEEKLYQYSVKVWGGADKDINYYIWANESQIKNAMGLLDKKPKNLDNPSAIAEYIKGDINSFKISSYNENSANYAAEELGLPLPFNPELIAEAMYVYKIRQNGKQDEALKCNYVAIPKSRIKAVFNSYKSWRKNKIELSVGCGIRGIQDSPFVDAKFDRDNYNSLEMIANEEHELKIALKRLGLPGLEDKT